MSEIPDYVISTPGPSFKGAAVIMESIGSRSFEENGRSIAEAIFSYSNMVEDEKPMIKSKQEFLEAIILNRSWHTNKEIISPDATDEEKEAHRQRFLNARTTRWRFVFSSWPRDPNGKAITPESSKSGKMAPNKVQLWGASLLNFYFVRRFPAVLGMATYSSGSKLAAWMKENGEDFARDELGFAEREENPHLIPPYEITRLIQDGDSVLRVGHKSWIRDVQDDEDSDESIDRKRKRKSHGKQKEREDWQVPQPWPPASPFDPLAYPNPWPIEPFTKMNYPKLEKYIIHSHLPKVLKVHDPWNLLRTTANHSRNDWKVEKWSDKTDIVHTYRLKTSTENTARKTEDDKLAEEEEARRQAVYDTFVADPHSRNELPSGILLDEESERRTGPAKPLVFIAFPLQPPIPPAREAHLYLSPSQCIGEGNHSFVYSAEFELPRSTIMEDKICHKCIMEDAHRTLIEEDGPNGERRDPRWDERVGRYVARETGKPPLTMFLGDEHNNIQDSGETEYLIEPSTLQIGLEYEGPYRLIHSKIGYQCLERGPYCDHIATSRHGIHPLTAKVKVAAKLSIPDDDHLDREAEAYQAFPRHFFEHWSGFNIVKPLQEPTPVGPLVPQFYGYYVPDVEPQASDVEFQELDLEEWWSGSEETSSCQYYGGLSPILLLEECGKQLDPRKLTLDDQNEAAALVFRFHDADWIHGSIFRRNIVVKPGPLSDFPLSRSLNSCARDGHGVDWSFRLIDFGRSYKMNNRSQREKQQLIWQEEAHIHGWIFMNGDLA